VILCYINLTSEMMRRHDEGMLMMDTGMLGSPLCQEMKLLWGQA
jgi:hypothetical protein